MCHKSCCLRDRCYHSWHPYLLLVLALKVRRHRHHHLHQLYSHQLERSQLSKLSHLLQQNFLCHHSSPYHQLTDAHRSYRVPPSPMTREYIPSGGIGPAAPATPAACLGGPVNPTSPPTYPRSSMGRPPVYPGISLGGAPRAPPLLPPPASSPQMIPTQGDGSAWAFTRQAYRSTAQITSGSGCTTSSYQRVSIFFCSISAVGCRINRWSIYCPISCWGTSSYGSQHWFRWANSTTYSTTYSATYSAHNGATNQQE